MKGSRALGELLKLLRGGMSQTELANQLRYDRTLISKAENGRHIPPEEVVNQWIEIGYENFKRMQEEAAIFNQMMAVAQRQEQVVM